ncbi:uncharacterized protein LOC128298756 [Anopheles moucheti]|uniref:uncharacterized protein LOC128298756 n=1 Tax=Anopheles moucheti TaxID=186751 RepID=UPI0022EFFC2D|nr:uncharacterized protein LOC128298756 [Anopheles moucheti]
MASQASASPLGQWSTLVCLLPVVFSGVQCFDHLSPGNELLLPEFEFGHEFRHDIERDLLPLDERSYYYHGEPDEGHAFQTDYNLANLRPISPTPAFTLDPSYISPEDVIPARAKRAPMRLLRRKPSKQRKREQDKELLSEEYGDGDEEDVEKNEKHVDSGEASDDVEDYAERYEQFIAKHFDDLDAKRKKSAPQRKAPAKKPTEGDDAADEEEEEDGDYKFDRFDYSSSEDYERIKAESEEQSRRLAKDPKNCRTYEKDGMVCSVCHDPASDSASESCAYATEPHHRKYAYVKERNYDSKKDDPNRAKVAQADENEADDEDEAEREHTSAEIRPERHTDVAIEGLHPTLAPKRTPTRPLRKPALRTKPHQSATNGGGYRYQPIDLRSNRASMKLKAADSENISTATDGQDDGNIYVMDYADQDEVAKVLADFKTRDWSNCRKGKRMEDGDLTCYQCTDAAGVNHEECMYVSESRLTASEIVRPPPSMVGKLRKRKKVVALTRKELAALEPPASAIGGLPAKEKQTVKRTVSFRSFITGSGRGHSKATPVSFGSDGDERVIHYEHHISHEVP